MRRTRTRWLPATVLAVALIGAGAPSVRADPEADHYGGGEADTVHALTLDSSLQEVPPAEPRRVPGARAMLLGAFALLILLPFVPGLFEVFRPRDRYPLPVDMAYAKDPRFFGISARAILAGALDLDAVAPGEHEATLSKPEIVEVRDDVVIPAGEDRDRLLYARGALQVGRGATCAAELFARGAATVADEAVLRTLSGEADATLGDRVVLERWLDVDGDADVGADCDLGMSAAAGGALTLGDGVRFHRLFGAPAATRGFTGDAGDPPPPAAPDGLDVDEIRTVEDLADYHEDDLTLAADDEPRHRPQVVLGDLELAPGAVLGAGARVHGDLKLGAGAVVHGDLFVEGKVELGEGARVRGNLFTQSRARLGAGARVGRPGVCKSLIAKLGLELAGDVAVHGYVLTEGRGRVSCAGSS